MRHQWQQSDGRGPGATPAPFGVDHLGLLWGIHSGNQIHLLPSLLPARFCFQRRRVTNNLTNPEG
jgi:hypothetical protein